MSKYLIDKYKKELMSYTFPYNKYDILMNQTPKKNEAFNETFNRSVFINTPKEVYLNDNNIIYYNSLKEVNDNINVWIEIFNMKTKFTDNELDIYLYYTEILSKIQREIREYAKRCKNKYNLNFSPSDTLSETLVKTYINILWERRLKIYNKLRIILEMEFKLYYMEYGTILLNLCKDYCTKILSSEEENEELYYEFKYKVREILDNSKKLLKVKEEEVSQWK